ncbi:porin [Caballeronia mineralivorans]|uniref:porin n=1 Tax=Caballeronia mineralivorans TaxID=2010198 RepID=UPI0023F12D98|nr:porin [Caballeronia mineralivorans]
MRQTHIAALNGSTAKFNKVDLGARRTITPSVFVGVGYDYADGKKVSSPAGGFVGGQHFNQVALIADYALSKRTDAYVEGAFQKASGVSSTGSAAAANIGNAGDSSSNRQGLVRVALRHKF